MIDEIVQAIISTRNWLSAFVGKLTFIEDL